MDTHEARSEFYSMIETGLLVATPAKARWTDAAKFAPEIRSVLDSFVTVTSKRSGAFVSRSEVGEIPPFPGYYMIGKDIDYTFVLVKPREEGIYITDGLDTLTELDDGAMFATIYHWLIF